MASLIFSDNNSIVNIKEIVQENKNLKKTIRLQEEEIKGLKEIIAILQRKKYGPSSEKNKEDAPFNEAEEEKKKDQEVKKYKRRSPRSPSINKDLPRVKKIIELREEDRICKNDGSVLVEIGEESSEEIEVIPAKVQVIETIRKKYACPCCEKGVKMAPLPEKLLPKTMASPSILAFIIIAKYADALPLYRQTKIFERIGFYLSRQTMARWLIEVSNKLRPLYNLLQDRLLDSNYIQMDETNVQVLREKGKKAKSKSYMWVRHLPGKDPIVLYDYAPSRSSTIPISLLEGFKGYLQVDGYSGYSAAVKKYDLKRVGCMDHCRRKFFDASKLSSGKGIGKKGIDYIEELYEIEKEMRGKRDIYRKEMREKKSRPVLKKMKSWLEKTKNTVTPKSVAGKAVAYALNEWSSLERYLEDGKLEMSNIGIENKIRPFVIGRKNWLFSASVEGAEASSLFYSLIETAKMNGLEPFEYLNKTLKGLIGAKDLNDYEELLPLKKSPQNLSK